MNSRKSILFRKAVEMARRSEATKFLSKCQAHADQAEYLLKRSYLQSLGAVRILRMAENLK